MHNTNQNNISSSINSTAEPSNLFDLEQKGGYAELYRYFVNYRYHASSTGAFPEIVVKYIMAQLLLPILHLHEQVPPLMHRDLKPENIVVMKEYLLQRNNQPSYIIPWVKLMDFGVARAQFESWQWDQQHQQLVNGIPTTNVGSPRYMAPEVYHTRNYNVACDIYSLGITLYFLIVGGLPNIPVPDRRRPETLDYKGIFMDPQAGPRIGKRISQEGFKLFVRMIAFKPQERFTARQCLEHPWFDDIREEARDVLNTNILVEIGRLRDERINTSTSSSMSVETTETSTTSSTSLSSNTMDETSSTLSTTAELVTSPPLTLNSELYADMPHLPDSITFHDVFECHYDKCVGVGATSRVYLCTLREDRPAAWDMYWNIVGNGERIPDILCVKIYDQEKLRLRSRNSIDPKAIYREFAFVTGRPHPNLIRLYYLFTELAPVAERANRATAWTAVYVVQEYAQGIRQSYYDALPSQKK